MGDDKFKISERRNKTLWNKAATFQLVEDSYIGGQRYVDADHLFRNPKESQSSFNARKKRALYINTFAMLINRIVGHVFEGNPSRSENEEYHIDTIYMRKWSIDRLMKKICRTMLMYTCGILVDSPRTPELGEISVQDAKDMRMYPYVKFVNWSQIYDFSYDEYGNLEWVMIDNTRENRSDPLLPDSIKKGVRVWTKSGYFDVDINDDGEEERREFQQIEGLEEVPFRMLNLIDEDDDGVAESYCEDIAYVQRGIYNYTSLIDEQLSGGAISVCFFPGYDKDKEGEIKAWGVVGTDPSAPLPEFKKPEIESISTYIQWIDWLISYTQNKFGAGTDREKDYTQSGRAKELDLKNIKAILSTLMTELEETENWIYRMCRVFDSQIKKEAKVKYNQDFSSEDLSTLLDSLREIMIWPYPHTVAKARKLYAAKTMGDHLTPEEIEDVMKEIDEHKIEETR